MTIQDWGSIGELVAAIATVLTLVYLAITIRANTLATQTESRVGITKDYRSIATSLLEPRVFSAWSKGMRRYPNMTPEENGMFSVTMTNEALFFQGVFAQYENGQLEEETYQAYLLWFCSLISTPGGAYIWEDSIRKVFVPKMVRAVDEQLASGEVLDILQQAAYRLEEDA